MKIKKKTNKKNRKKLERKKGEENINENYQRMAQNCFSHLTDHEYNI